MHHAVVTHVENPGPLTVAGKTRALFATFAVAGALAFAGGVALDPSRAWHAYLISFFMFTCFGLAGLFFTALNQGVNAKWSIVVRRVAEGMTAFLPVAALLFLGLIVGQKHLYKWAIGEFVGDPTKAVWLSPLWVNVRGVVFFLIWLFFSWKLVGFSVKQDSTGDPLLSRKAINWSVIFFPLFAGTFTLASFDWIMSLQDKFFSTMYGVYCFAGLFQSGLAVITLIFLYMKKEGGPLHAVATPSHVKDLGGLLFAFTVFMTYIGFSQFMLIWYANLPEETFYFLQRTENGWLTIFLLLPLLKFAIPFFGLLGQAQKKNERWLRIVCIVILFGQFFDLYWLVMPTHSVQVLFPGWIEVGTWLFFAGLFGLAVSMFYSKNSVLAARDPRILESANWRMWD